MKTTENSMRSHELCKSNLWTSGLLLSVFDVHVKTQKPSSRKIQCWKLIKKSSWKRKICHWLPLMSFQIHTLLFLVRNTPEVFKSCSLFTAVFSGSWHLRSLWTVTVWKRSVKILLCKITTNRLGTMGRVNNDRISFLGEPNEHPPPRVPRASTSLFSSLPLSPAPHWSSTDSFQIPVTIHLIDPPISSN